MNFIRECIYRFNLTLIRFSECSADSCALQGSVRTEVREAFSKAQLQQCLPSLALTLADNILNVLRPGQARQ
jgi:hypothetical protein